MRGTRFLEATFAELPRLLKAVGKAIWVDGKQYREILNVQFVLPNYMELKNVPQHKCSVGIERQYFLMKARLAARMIRKDIGCRRACFPYIRNWGKFFCHCIAMVHFYSRASRLNMNVYVRSWEYNTFFDYDIDTLLLARQIAAKKLNMYEGEINVFVMSLHEKAK